MKDDTNNLAALMQESLAGDQHAYADLLHETTRLVSSQGFLHQCRKIIGIIFHARSVS